MRLKDMLFLVVGGMCSLPASSGEDGAATTSAPMRAVRLSLPDCVALATARNLDILRRALDNRKQELSLYASQHRWTPNLSAGFTPHTSGGERSASVSVSVPASPFGTSVSVTASQDWGGAEADTSVSATLTQPLLEGANRFDNIMSLYNQRVFAAESRNSLEKALQDLIYEVHRRYLAAIRQELTVKVQEKALSRVMELHRATKEKERLGMVTVLDVAEVEDQLASRRLALKTVKEAYLRALDDLKRLLDIDVETPVVLAPVSINTDQYENDKEKVELSADEATCSVYRVFTLKNPPPGAPSVRRETVFEPAVVDPDVVLERALANRLDLANARLELARLRLAVEASRRGLLPDIDLSLSYSWDGSGSSVAASFPLDGPVWSVSLSLSMPLAPVEERAGLRKTLLDYEKQRMAVRDIEERVRKEVRDLLRDLDTASYAVYSYALRLRSAHIGLESAKVTYEMGHTGFFRVLDAEDRLLDAEKSFISAYLDYSLLLQRLAVVTGAPSGLLPALVDYGRKVEERLVGRTQALPEPPKEVLRLLRSPGQAFRRPFPVVSSERAAPGRAISLEKMLGIAPAAEDAPSSGREIGLPAGR